MLFFALFQFSLGHVITFGWSGHWVSPEMVWGNVIQYVIEDLFLLKIIILSQYVIYKFLYGIKS